MIKSKCISQFHWLGLQNYKDLADQQKKLVPEILDRNHILVFGAEFFPVLTLGVRGKVSEDLFLSPQDTAYQGLEIIKTDRGGQATIHSPGQLIIYPMLDLKMHGLGMQDFVSILMRTTVATLQDLGIKASYLTKDPGVHTDYGKLGFCGLRSDQGVIRHGLSINIKNDLSLFQGIRSCGHSQAQLDQVSRYISIGPEVFSRNGHNSFRRIFICQSLNLLV